MQRIVPQAGTRSTLIVLLISLLALGPTGCFSKRGRDRTEAYAQALAEQKTQTDNLRNAMRHLKQMTPLNREQSAKEVQLELNTWIANADRTQAQYAPSPLLLQFNQQVPSEMLKLVGCQNPLELQFSLWDVDYLYQCRIVGKLSHWITDFPVRDNLMEPILEKYASRLSATDKLKLMNAYKLFDWTVRNIALEASGASVEELTSDPRAPIEDNGMGYGYLPWETLLFSAGDFIERGRVFNALAAQQGIETVWLAVDGAQQDADKNAPGKLWTIGVLIGDDCLLFEPKLGMPILEPDLMELATLAQTLDNDRILRRLDLAGQFDYALEKSDIQNFEFLIDAPPTAASARMKMLEQALLGDERMVLYQNLDALAERLESIAPGHAVHLWRAPLLSQVQAASVRERMKTLSPYSMSYMAKHGVWLMETAAANGRRKHLVGEFENTLDADGALKTYMSSRIDDETLAKLPYDPEVQHALGVPQVPGEPKEQHEARIAQMQYILSLSKFAAHYLLAQLHFDRGNYQASEDFWVKRVLDDPRAQNWWAAGHYTLARIYQETGRPEKAAEELQFEASPQAAGNRLRLRYLRREE
ncbi:MAG: hypothetical protein R3C09_06620 [Pirellulaceae bacterium]